jgi:hypothetical protein
LHATMLSAIIGRPYFLSSVNGDATVTGFGGHVIDTVVYATSRNLTYS